MGLLAITRRARSYPCDFFCLALSLSFPCPNVATHGPVSMRVARKTHITQLPENRMGTEAQKSKGSIRPHGETRDGTDEGVYSIKVRVRGRGDIKAHWGSLS